MTKLSGRVREAGIGAVKALAVIAFMLGGGLGAVWLEHRVALLLPPNERPGVSQGLELGHLMFPIILLVSLGLLRRFGQKQTSSTRLPADSVLRQISDMSAPPSPTRRAMDLAIWVLPAPFVAFSIFFDLQTTPLGLGAGLALGVGVLAAVALLASLRNWHVAN